MSVNPWRKIPVVRLLLPFVLGIILGLYCDPPLSVIILSGFLALLILGSFSISRSLSSNSRFIFNLSLHLLLILLGAFLTHINHQENDPFHFGQFDDTQFFDVVIVTDPLPGASSDRIVGEVLAVRTGDRAVRTRGRMMLYISKKIRKTFTRGDRVFIAKPAQTIDPPRNPGEFDYRSYLQRRGITHKVFVQNPEEVRLLDKAYRRDWRVPFDRSREWLLSKLQEALDDENSFAVGSALLLGMKDHLTRDLQEAYSGTGAMHVLAVSGLHVGILYLILNTALRFVGRAKWMLWIRLIILLSALWTYALITGLSPSVTRAATMFSTIALAQNIGRRANIFNSLGLAALVMLCVNPMWILEVGFQLSFAAVTGIVLFQPKIYRVFIFNHWLIDKIWSLSAVSIAAQLATFPLGIYYFNQFPNYFLLSNLVVIPGAFATLVVGIITFSLSWISGLFDVIGNLLNLILYFMNSAVFWMDSLPNAHTGGIALNELELIAIYLALGCLAAWIYLWRGEYLIAGLISICLFLGQYSYRIYQRNTQAKVLIADIHGHTCLNFLDHKRNILLADSALLRRPGRIRYSLANYWSEHGYHEPTAIIDIRDSLFFVEEFQKRHEFVSFYGYRLFLGDDNSSLKPNAPVPQVDAIIARRRFKILSQSAIPDVVLSPEYQYYNLCCDSIQASVYDVRKKGAWQVRVESLNNPEEFLRPHIVGNMREK